MHRRNAIISAICYIFVVMQSLELISAHSTTPTTTTTQENNVVLSSDYNQHQHSVFSDEDYFRSSEYDDDLDIPDDEEQNEQQNHEWDILIFTQQWPVTTCYHWRENDKTHKCMLPDQKEFWTIHGIWPTKLGHIGPNFCNKSSHFDIEQIEQIMDKMRLYWPDIEGDVEYSWLWKHEWLKHGTCAAMLENLDNELKYFGQGLAWRSQYLISNILGSAGVHPDSNNTVIVLNTALRNHLGKNPSIHCIYDNKRDISFLDEIRICFDKTLQVTDCDGVKRGDAVSIDYPGGNVITNCPISKPVHYPSLVPPVLHQNRDRKWKFPVVNLYKLIQFVMWFTL